MTCIPTIQAEDEGEFDPVAAIEALDSTIPVPQPVDVFDRDQYRDMLIDEGRKPDEVVEMVSKRFGAKGVNPKDLIGATKVDLSVVPPAAQLHLASAMMDGAVKYGPFNWRENKVLGRVYVAAAQRHLLQYLDGEDKDPTSQVHHLGHAMACMAIILDAYETGNLDDNRPVPGAAGGMIRRFDTANKF